VCDVMVVCGRLEHSEMCQHAETVETESTDVQAQYCVTQCGDTQVQSSALSWDNHVSELATSLHPADSRCPELESPATLLDSQDVEVCRCHMRNDDGTRVVDSKHSTAQSYTREMNASTLACSDDSLLLEQECQSSTADVSDTVSDVVDTDVGNTDLHLHPAAHETVTVISCPELDLPPCNDSNISLDSDGHNIASVETERKPAVGFSESDSDDSVDDTRGKYEASASTQAESFTRNTIVHDAVTSHRTCEPECVTCSLATVTTDSVVTKLSVRYILSASLKEVSQPVEETVAHIGSTHVHVTDELSIINGVVQPVDCGVKIGELCILWVL